MDNNKGIDVISKLLSDLASEQPASAGKPAFDEKEIDRVVSAIYRQDYGPYNQLLDKLEDATVSVDYLKSIFRGIVDMLIIVKPDNTVYQTNATVSKTLGYTQRELKGRHFKELFPHDDLRPFKEINKALEKKGYFHNIEHAFCKKNGTKVSVSSSCSLIYDNRHIAIGMLYIIKDISEVKKTERLLKAKHDDLNTFVYKASHDLRGPLSTISGVVNMAKQEFGEKEEIIKYLDYISTSINTLDDALRELLEFTQIAQKTLAFSPINFNILIRETVRSLQYLDHYKKVDFRVTVDQEEEFISDQVILRSVLHNVLHNAIKYGRYENNTPFIAIRINTSQRITKIKIEDNGMGMDADILENIFKMFYRGNQRSDGSGLGLYIAKTGMERLGGLIWAESKVNEGSVFSIQLPNKQDISSRQKELEF